MTTYPRVSVLMAVYNGGEFLRAAMDSILSQSFTDFEFVIVDDGSTDATPKILAEYSDPRVRIYTVAHVGLTAAINIGLAECRGEFIARMDSDDIARIDRLDSEVAVMDVEPTVDIICSDILSINRDGQVIGAQSVRSVTNDLIRDGLLSRRVVKPIINPTVLMRRRVIEKLICYRDFTYCEEHDFWLRAVDRFTFRRINEPLLKYRIHPGGVTRSKYAVQATSGCMSAVNYLVEKNVGVDIFSERPLLFKMLSTLARERLESKLMPASRAFRDARESMVPGRTAVGYWSLISVVFRYGPFALPVFGRRRYASLIESLVKMALRELETCNETLAVRANEHS